MPHKTLWQAGHCVAQWSIAGLANRGTRTAAKSLEMMLQETYWAEHVRMCCVYTETTVVVVD